MAFQETLQRVIDSVEGGVSCILMGSDGLVVESCKNPNLASSLDAVTFGIECTGLLRNIMEITQQTNFCPPNEFTMQSEQHTAIFRFLNENYFVLLTLIPEGNVGKGKFLLRTSAPKLRQELIQ